MPAVLLIRHGETDYVGKRLAGRLPGIHLNETGRRQAEAVAQQLKVAPIQAVYSSPLERTLETAQALAAALDLPVQTDEALLEVNFGAWQGKTVKQMHRMKLWKMVQEKPSQVRFPQGESFSEAQARLVAFLDGLREKHTEKDLVACFSHSDAIKLAIAHYLGMPLDTFQRLHVDTASISLLFLGQGRPGLLTLNQSSINHWQKAP
jgi:probable phosphoglycerate mutase